jgi:hypothetical protein
MKHFHRLSLLTSKSATLHQRQKLRRRTWRHSLHLFLDARKRNLLSEIAIENVDKAAFAQNSKTLSSETSSVIWMRFLDGCNRERWDKSKPTSVTKRSCPTSRASVANYCLSLRLRIRLITSLGKSLIILWTWYAAQRHLGFLYVDTDRKDQITFEPMHDPVMTRNGHSYERATIYEHLKRSKTDPLTREPLTIDELRPNYGLKAACDEFWESGASDWIIDW